MLSGQLWFILLEPQDNDTCKSQKMFLVCQYLNVALHCIVFNSSLIFFAMIIVSVNLCTTITQSIKTEMHR